MIRLKPLRGSAKRTFISDKKGAEEVAITVILSCETPEMVIVEKDEFDPEIDDETRIELTAGKPVEVAEIVKSCCWIERRSIESNDKISPSNLTAVIAKFPVVNSDEKYLCATFDMLITDKSEEEGRAAVPVSCLARNP